MKDLYLLLFSISLLTGTAQTSIQLSVKSTSASVAPNTIYQFTTSPAPASNSFVSITLDIKNASTINTITYSVKKYTLARNIPAAGDSAYPTFCVGGQCYGAPTKTADVPFTLAPLESTGTSTISYYSWDIDCMESIIKRGYTSVKYTVFNVDNPSDSVQISAIYNEDEKYTGLTENNKSQQMRISPNPASRETAISLGTGACLNCSIRLYNMTGQLVSSSDIFTELNQARIDLSGISPGLYVAEIQGINAIIRERLVVE